MHTQVWRCWRVDFTKMEEDKPKDSGNSSRRNTKGGTALSEQDLREKKMPKKRGDDEREVPKDRGKFVGS